MYARPIVSQEWSVHAQLTISHSRPDDDGGAAPDVAPPPTTTKERREPGDVHMEYSWGGQPNSPTPPASSTNIPPRTCYGFQRGNILFTTRPPATRESQVPKYTQQPAGTSSQNRQGITNLLDSGYSSEQISPGSYASLPTRRPAQPYSRRCKSTCSIVLSGTESQGVASASMRPNVEEEISEDSIRYPSGYRCGDPVCYHQQTPPPPAQQEARPRSSDFATLPETCEVCGGGRSPTAIRRAAAANTFTTHFCTRVPERVARENVDPEKLAVTSKDAASQTSDHLETNSGTLLDKTGLHKNKPSQPKVGNKAYTGARRKTDTDLLQLPMINVEDPDAETKKPSSGKRLSRSPAQRLSRSPARLRGQSPLAGRKSKGSQCASTQAGEPFEARSQRKPRTVHIDVYCTGSEDADASGSTDDTEEMSDSWSSPQTVFESEKLRVVHSKVGKERLPVGFLRRQQQQQRQEKVANIISRRSESFKYEAAKTPEQQKQQQETMRGYDSDDGLSSHYPSQVSSYSTLRAATESSLPQSEVATTASRDSSWSTISTSSMAIGGEYDSEAATSWKDTATDLESLVQSTLSLAQSDSFEYADSADRLRIREKERAWAGEEKKDDGSKTWKSPNTERKHFLQQQKMKEFLEKHLGTSSLPLWKPPTTEDSDDDETGDAWSFCGRDSAGSPRQSSTTLKREDTVKRMTPAKDKNENHGSSPKGSAKTTSLLKPPPRETGSLSDSGPHRYMRRTAIGPFGSKSPSPPPSKLASSITSPFTTIPGKRTDQLSKAEKFGRIVGALRKPGHHVGPSKNPECACEHCRKYYEETGHRTRTRSVGDVPVDDVSGNWKENLNALKAKIVPTSGTNDGTAGLESDLESSITEDASTDNEKLIRQHISSVIGSEDDDNDE